MKRLALFIFLMVSMSTVFAQTAVQPAGDGTSGNPYKIANLNNLYWMAVNPTQCFDKYFYQTADIDASDTWHWFDAKGWTPIGNGTYSFGGAYDGNGYKISNLYINRPGTDKIGLFGNVSNNNLIFNLRNICLKDVNITGDDNVGGILGYCLDVTMEECKVSGSVSGDQYVGGLAGYIWAAEPRFSFSSCNVNGNTQVGGLVGYSSYGCIMYSYATGDVVGVTEVGGLTGTIYQSCTILDCFASGSVTGTDKTGGLLGLCDFNAHVMECYSYAAVSGSTNTGGLVGLNTSFNTIYNSYWDKEASGQSSSDGGTGKTTAEMKTQSTYTLWYFLFSTPSIWGICPGINNGYPFIAKHYPDPVQPSGSGLSSDPYIITDLANIFWVVLKPSHWDKYYKQSADINLTLTEKWDTWKGFAPIGRSDLPFTGSYDGQRHKVSNLFIDRSSSSYMGLFGYVSSGEISNLGVTNVNISGAQQVGALAGEIYNGSTVSSCFSTGTLTGTSQQAGGLVGYSYSNSVIQNSYSSVNVTGVERVGGLVGYNLTSTIRNCYATGNVSGSYRYIGGLAGINLSSGIIENSYSTGSVTGSTNGIGGLLGYNESTVTDCFWDTETSGQSTSAAGTGKTTAEMKDIATSTNLITSGLINAWDFIGNVNNDYENNDYWDINGVRNDGYPFLYWEVLRISTSNVTNVTMTTATGNGNITCLGDTNPTQHGVCWNTTGMPTTSDYKTSQGAVSAAGPFTSAITGLTGAVNYFVRAYATDSEGTAYGEELSFVTAPAGEGTDIDPYQIYSLNCLVWLSQNSDVWDKYLIQTTDIDASDTQEMDCGFSPIGNEATKFSGSYDGQGFVIDGIFIGRYETNWVGFFGAAYQANIYDLGITNANIGGYSQVGILVGENFSECNINNCYTTGWITGYGDQVGGLVGYNVASSVISNCYSDVGVVGNQRVGGLVGYNLTAAVSNCYAFGNVMGSYRYIGGLVGYNDANVTNSFWDTETSGQLTSAGGTGKTTTEMQTLSTFTSAGWDFAGESENGIDDLWNIDETNNEGYPWLSWQQFGVLTPTNVSVIFDMGVIQLSWDDVNPTGTYSVYVSNDPYAEFPMAWMSEATDLTEPTWTDMNTSGDMKFYRIVAVSGIK